MTDEPAAPPAATATAAPNPDDPVLHADEPRAPTEYERALRSELWNAKEALRIAKAEHDAALAKLTSKNAEKLTEVQRAAQQRIVNTDLRAALGAAGASSVDDMLALLPRDKLVFNDAGEATNIAALVAEMKTTKPWGFGQTSTSSTATPPAAPAGGTAKSAMAMTGEEFKAARAAAIGAAGLPMGWTNARAA